MTHHSLSLVLLYLCSLTGCAGHAVDLDHTAPAASTPIGPDAGIVIAKEGFAHVWVDDQRLYWLTQFGTFQSCVKASCEHTRLTYVNGNPESHLLSAAVANGHVYWVSDRNIVFSCAAEGCDAGPVMVVQDSILQRIYAHQDHVYWSSDRDFYRCPASGCGATPEIAISETSPAFPAFDGTRIYWIGGFGIMSAPADGSASPELVVDWHLGAEWIQSIAVGGEYLYWAAGTQAFRCPIASCNASAPTLLVTGNDRIHDLRVDVTTMYWSDNGHTDKWSRLTDIVRSCPLEGCEQSTALTPPRLRGHSLDANDSSTFAIDATDIYWIDVGDDPSSPTRINTIRKTAK